MIKKALLVNPPSALSVYKTSKVRAAIPRLPSMSLAMIAGSLLEEKIEVKICDLMLSDKHRSMDIFREELRDFKPDMVGVTATTPLFYEAVRIGSETKSFSTEIVTILGGPHASSIPQESLQESSFDIVVCGEGEQAIKTIINSTTSQNVKGVYCRRQTPTLPAPEKTDDVSLDNLPFPALHLFQTRLYGCPRMIARNNPVGPIEMSRGCVFNCSYCNKTVCGRTFKIKSPKRIIDELLILKKLGYREFHVLDDQLTTDIAKAKQICEEIIRNNINLTWNLRTGIRVDTIDEEFLRVAKRSGCYQVGIGFESGNQDCLDAVGKGITLERAFRAARMIKKAGIEFVGFFMLGLPQETILSMQETIRFAIRLDPDYAKATILAPFPGTRIYDQFGRQGLIKTKDWSKYNFHTAHEIYDHPTLNWKTLTTYYELFHKKFYFRPSYILKRLWKALMQGRLLDDLYYAAQTFCYKK